MPTLRANGSSHGAAPELAPGSSTAQICFCRHKGKRLPVGTVICLDTNAGPRRARCEMSVNVTSWKITEEGCPLASRSLPRA